MGWTSKSRYKPLVEYRLGVKGGREKERKKRDLSNPRRCISGQTQVHTRSETVAYTCQWLSASYDVSADQKQRQGVSTKWYLTNSARCLHQFILGKSGHAIAPLEGHHGNETQQHDMSQVTSKE